jgi:16S rRNA processing protein RimM
LQAAAREDRALSGEGRVLVGVIVGAHGIKGAVKIRCFTEDPKTIGTLGPLTDASGRSYALTMLSSSKGQVLARIEGLADRNGAEALRSTQLFAARERFPRIDADEFYAGDLVGLTAIGRDGAALGTVKAILDYGAGAVLQISRAGGGEDLLLPFTRSFVPEIDLAGRRLIVDPPSEIEAEDGP